MNSKKKNLIIGGVTIVVIILIIVGIYLYMKKIRHEKKIQEQLLKNTGGGIDEVYKKMKKQKDIQDDAAGKLAREKYKKSGVKTLTKDTTNVIYKEIVGSVWDDPSGSSKWDDEY
jgi:hypothetical protein